MNEVIIDNDGELTKIENVADVAEMTPGRLQAVFADGESEFYSGTLFGAWGEWRVWLDMELPDELEQRTGEDPLTMPAGFIRIKMETGTCDRAANIKRLKRPDL